MTNEALGFNATLEQYRKEQNLEGFEYARVTSEHKERYTIKSIAGEYDAELLGNLRFTAESRYDFPAVGDWVAYSEYDEGKALIHAIYPRFSIIERKAVGKSSDVQIIATNIDCGLIVQAVDRDFNINRLERYITICNTSDVTPIIVLSKIDLIDKEELENLIESINNRLPEIAVLSVSNQTTGYNAVKSVLQTGKTYCLLGSSGVGKSTLLNALLGYEEMKTNTISDSVNKGKHTTTHRELIVLDSGGIIIDNPGMREVGITDSGHGLELTFETILEYADDCRFSDCSHTHEEGCAIIEAVESGEIDRASYENFLKMEREKEHYEASTFERRKKDKAFGKMVKNVVAQKATNRHR